VSIGRLSQLSQERMLESWLSSPLDSLISREQVGIR
jgi:hypothetical protein